MLITERKVFPMTLKEFHKLALKIQSEEFKSSSDGFTYGLERAVFDQEKFKKLIELAREVDCKTGQTRLALWERQLERAIKRQARFEEMLNNMRAEAKPSKWSKCSCAFVATRADDQKD